MDASEAALRREIVARCREMNALGINQGASGNISARLGERMLITPSAVAYDQMTPEMIAAVPFGAPDDWEGPLKPSTEWRFHLALLRDRPDAMAVLHAHSIHCTALAMARRDVPVAHYMVAAFGGNSVRCSGYAAFGTEELARLALQAMEGRTACLLANHGMIVLGESLDRAMWRAVELETLARQYILSLQIGGPVVLPDEAVDETLARFAGYGAAPRE